jgi:DnaJ-class molecular chaperone
MARIKCPQCFGTGRCTSCQRCEGRGWSREEGDATILNAIFGTGKTECPACKGSGTRPAACGMCDGTGMTDTSRIPFGGPRVH